jgi:hypothetical protein
MTNPWETEDYEAAREAERQLDAALVAALAPKDREPKDDDGPEMWFVNVYPEKGKPRWVAIWKRATGNVIHDTLGRATEGMDRDTARQYAEAHPPTWGQPRVADAWLAERARGEMAK